MTDDKTEVRSSPCHCLEKASSAIVWALETFFYKLGGLVARNPIKTIAVCLLVCGACGLGLMRWHEETDYVKVWLPRNSRMRDEHAWVQDHFPEEARYTSVIVENSNVLTPEVLQVMMNLYREGNTYRLEGGNNLFNICIRAGPLCRVSSLLELWAYNDTIIQSVTSDDILHMVNSPVKYSPVYGNEIELEKVLGNIRRNSSGSIVTAEATVLVWILQRQEQTRLMAEEWEQNMIDTVTNEEHPDVSQLYIYAARTFDDEAVGAVSDDLILLSVGFGLVLVFVVMVISKYSMLEHKVYVAFAGLLSIALAIVFTYGVGLGTGIMFGPIHQIMPFMLLGIGVDDMFVVVEAMKHLTEKENEETVEERMALTLKKAGVSITVTSVTDMVAFGIGGSTVIPSLSTFCVYAAIGVTALYILQATFFVACLTLDQRRVGCHRDACGPCYKHGATYRPNKHSDFSVQHLFMDRVLGPALTKTPIKVLVIVMVMGLTGVNIWSFSNLKEEFDFALYLPTDSYSKAFVLADRRFFPGNGRFALVYCGDVDYYHSARQLEDMNQKVSAESGVQSSTVDFWLVSFSRWLNTSTQPEIQARLNNDSFPSNEENFFHLLGQFLITREGGGYQRHLKFDNTTAPKRIMASSFTFQHKKFPVVAETIDSMLSVRSIVDSYTYSSAGTCFAYGSEAYMFNEVNMVLKTELYRNLALAAVCVFIVTLILIANLWTSLLVFICVVCTVMDIAGALQFWGITIDTASSVLLILCFGLAVDYSAHVGHTFMTVTGSNNERAKRTLVEIGPAVFNGGFSTFLAFILLVKSTSYGFTLFFRVFTLVVVLGLFHGLVFLPVVLSLIGPKPYSTRTGNQPNSPIQHEQLGSPHRELTWKKHGKRHKDKNDAKWRFSNVAYDNGVVGSGYPGNMLQGKEYEGVRYQDTCTAEIRREQAHGRSGDCEQLSDGSYVMIPPPDYSPLSVRMHYSR